MKVISMNLSRKSISSAIRQLERYVAQLNESTQLLTYNLTEQGVALAQQNASYMDIYDSGELVNGIESRYVGGFNVGIAKGYVESTATHSIFCEFGTGTVGAGSPHPNTNIVPGWQYDVNQHGEKGWYYYDRYGEKRWTKGMPSRPFMFDTGRMLRSRIIPTAKEIFP